MAQVVVQVDEEHQRMARVLETPLEAHKATFEWLFQKLPFPVMVFEGPVDLETQTVQGVPLSQIYKSNEGKFVHSFIVQDGVHHVSKE